MDRKCYDCGKPLTLDQAVEGQEWLHWANHYPRHFEGWVHCMGEDAQFIQEDDEDLIERMIQLGMNCECWRDGLIVCEPCVKKTFTEETRVQIPEPEKVTVDL